MKTDCEFIAGIYEKAEKLEQSNNLDVITFKEVSSNYIKKTKLQLVASLALVLLTGIGYSNNIFNATMLGGVTEDFQTTESDLNPMLRNSQPMSAGAGDLNYNPIEQAEVICTAKVSSINENIYSMTTIETIKGAINQEFELLVDSVVDEVTEFFLEQDEEVLLFLETSYNDINLYILAGSTQGKYSLIDDEIYQNNLGIQYTVNDLKTHFGLEN